MSHIFSVTGIIIKRRNYREADKWLTIFTHELGKVEVLAKGVRKITSKRGGQFELFNLVKLQVVEGKRYNVAAEVELIDSFPQFRKDLKKVGLVYELCEVVDLLTAEEQPHEDIFESIKRYVGVGFSDPSIGGRENLAPTITRILVTLGFWDGRREAEKMKELPFLRNYIENIIEKRLKSPDIL